MRALNEIQVMKNSAFYGLRAAITLTLLPIGMMGQIAAAQASPAKKSNAAAEQRFAKMFSPKVRAIMNACDRQGEVNLMAGADRDGSVICNNGSRKSSVQYADYSEFVTDLLTAFLIGGMRAGMSELTASSGKPEAGKLEAVKAIINAPETREKLGKNLQAMWRSETGTNLPGEFRDRILQKTYAIFNDPQKLTSLLGTGAEYNLVVENFCSPKGQTLKAAKQIVPKLNAVQMYSICIHEAGFR
jgi:hypothetical protein